MQDFYIRLLIITALIVAASHLAKRDWRLVICCAAVVLNWIVNTAYVIQTGETDAIGCFFATDAVSLGVILLVARKRLAGQMLAATYAIQIAAHGLHQLAGNGAWDHWLFLTVIADGQLAILIGAALLPNNRHRRYAL